MPKFAHIADTHIRNLKYHAEYREVFQRLFEELREQKVDFIVHCGDIAHSKTQISPEYVQLCSEFLTGLSAVAPTYIILGNHDGNLKNSSRQDAITPIIKALDLPNLFLLKNSGEVSLGNSTNLNILSVFDRDNWKRPTDKNKINIAIYHGAISNCETDLGWIMENGEDELSIFKGHDYAFLGDIHKTNQSLDKAGKIRYCGSTIQQNFGETNDKGFLLWDIKDKDDFVVNHISIPNPRPFVTIVLTKKGRIPAKASSPEGARLRLISNNNLPLHLMKKAISAAKHRFKPERLTFLNNAKGRESSNLENSNSVASDNLRDVAVQESLIKEFLSDFQPSEEMLESVYALNRKYNSTVESGEDIQRNINWRLESFEWDNLFNFGEKNKINFNRLNGTVGLFGKNYSGKSSIVDGILYTLFNSTSKNERKNLNVINQNKDSCVGTVIISVGHQQFSITRTSEKYVKKLKGDETLEAKTEVDFNVLDTLTGETLSLNGLTRNETDSLIRKQFGTLEDFLITSMSSQLGALQFINEGSTRRKEILAKFLDLEIFDKKFKLAKEDASNLRGALKRLEGKEFDEEIFEAEKELMFIENETATQESLCELLDKELKEVVKEKEELEKTFAEIPNDLINITDTLNQIEAQEEEKAETHVQMEELCVKLIDNKEVLDKIEDLLSVFDIDDINNQKSKIDEKLSILEKAENDLESTRELIKDNKKKITLLDEVPCGDQFRSCKFIKDASETKEELPNLFKVLEDYKEELTKHQKEFEELDKEKIDSYIEKHQAILEKKNKLEKDTLKIDSQHKGLENNLLLLENNLSSLFLQKEEYEQNKEAIENKGQLKKNINGFVGDIRKKTLDREECQKKVMSYYKDHGSLEEKIRSLQEQKQELSELHEEYTAYDLFMNCVHSNGIAYDIIKRKLPVINSEIAKILANIVDFSIFFEADNRKLKIFIQHARHEPRPLEIGSGAEKTIAAMAIRLAFLTVSSLPRSDIFILDEPGTALDEENMEGFVSILDLIKSYFKTIILISHLESLKDCVDSHISIEKKEGFAFVQEV
jgi:DNA repair exonuclease SbcCD ATPase subunit/DNA repair exonuclease SbcCD nuclease subunit